MIKKFKMFEDNKWQEESFEVFEQTIDAFRKRYQEVVDIIQEHSLEVFKIMTHKEYVWKIIIVLKKDRVWEDDFSDLTKDFKSLSDTIRNLRGVPVFNDKCRIQVSSLLNEYYGEYKGHPYVEVYID